MKPILVLLAIVFSTTVNAQQKTWTCIDSSGKELFSIQARWVYDFSNGLARIQKRTVINNKWVSNYGFINRKGEVVIPCVYEKANDFKTNVTWVKKKGSDIYSLIDQSGKTIPTKPYKKVGTIVSGFTDRLAVYKNGAMGFINQEGTEVIPCKYSGSVIFSDGLCCVTPYNGNGKYGFIDPNGNIAIPFKYNQGGTSSFNNGLCRAKVQGRTVLINKKGKVVFKTKYRTLQGFKMNRAAVCTKANRKGWGFVNQNDELIIGGDYDHAKSFDQDGYAIVEKNGLKGLIDTNGKLVLPMKYSTIYADYSKSGFYCGVYPSNETLSLSNSKKDYFLKNFTPLKMKVKYLGHASGSNLIKFAATNGKIGFINRKGEIKIPAIYDKANSFQEGLAWTR
jgi:hypothetical protein